MKNLLSGIAAGLGLAVLFCAIIFAIISFNAWILMILWNWVVPALGGPHIGFWLSMGVSLLSSALFGSVKLKKE